MRFGRRIFGESYGWQIVLATDQDSMQNQTGLLSCHRKMCITIQAKSDCLIRLYTHTD